ARGLTRDRWSRPTLTLLHTAALVPALLAAATVLTVPTTGKDGQPERPVAVAIGAGFVLWWALAAAVRWFTDQRDTPAGRVAAARTRYGSGSRAGCGAPRRGGSPSAGWCRCWWAAPWRTSCSGCATPPPAT